MARLKGRAGSKPKSKLPQGLVWVQGNTGWVIRPASFMETETNLEDAVKEAGGIPKVSKSVKQDSINELENAIKREQDAKKSEPELEEDSAGHSTTSSKPSGGPKEEDRSSPSTRSHSDHSIRPPPAAGDPMNSPMNSPSAKKKAERSPPPPKKSPDGGEQERSTTNKHGRSPTMVPSPSTTQAPKVSRLSTSIELSAHSIAIVFIDLSANSIACNWLIMIVLGE